MSTGHFDPCAKHGPHYHTMICLPCEIEQLSKALAFYAEPRNLHPTSFPYNDQGDGKPGFRARAALKGVSPEG